MLGTVFASRSPEAFARALEKHGVPGWQAEEATRAALAAHSEAHLALEFLSELRLRACILRRLGRVDGYDALHGALCTMDAATQRRLRAALRGMAIPDFYWEDVVLRAR